MVSNSHNDDGKESLEGRLTVVSSQRKIAIVDTVGNITYSLITGGALDCMSGLDLRGVIASRTYGTVINTVTGAPYGRWREQIFKVTNTTEDNGRLRKTIVDLLAFNTFQVPLYLTVIAVGSLISEGRVDWNKVKHGGEYLAMASPFIAPTMGWYMDRFRRLFGISSAAEGAYKK